MFCKIWPVPSIYQLMAHDWSGTRANGMLEGRVIICLHWSCFIILITGCQGWQRLTTSVSIEVFGVGLYLVWWYCQSQCCDMFKIYALPLPISLAGQDMCLIYSVHIISLVLPVDKQYIFLLSHGMQYIPVTFRPSFSFVVLTIWMFLFTAVWIAWMLFGVLCWVVGDSLLVWHYGYAYWLPFDLWGLCFGASACMILRVVCPLY